MNFIAKLILQNKAKTQALADVQAEINAFIAHLHSDKFKGQESNGERKDWIATGDVLARLIELRGIAQNANL